MSMRVAVGRFLLASAVPCGLTVLALAAAGPTSPERVSIGDQGAVPDSGSYEGAATDNGRFVAFSSDATNLIAEDGNEYPDVFVRDRKSGETLLVSHDAAGAPGNSYSYYPSISANGRFVVFESYATDLVDVDGNGVWDVFLADMKTGDVMRVSEPPGGGDGDSHAFVYGASISKNGRYVAYYSGASNLVADDSNEYYDVFLFDRVRGTTTLVSRNADGDPANGDSDDPSISANGRFVTYYSYATDLPDGGVGESADIFVYDARTGTTTMASPGLEGAGADGGSYDPVVSDNGRWVAFYSDATNLVAGDTNGFEDTFLYDRKTGEMRRVSVTADGTEGSNHSYEPAMSANGKVLVFYSSASNLSPDDANGGNNDIFRVDLKTGALTLLSRNADGTGGDDGSYFVAPALSPNGHYLAFGSSATNLEAGDTNGNDDTFLLRLK
jgi:Tol biopolymer transport system component